MAITKKEIDEIKSRLEKASPGPWRVASTTGGEYILDCDDWVVAATFERKEDAYFVAHAREDIPNLLDHIAELEAEIERLDLFLQEIDTHIRSTPEPLPYIIETMRNYLDYQEDWRMTKQRKPSQYDWQARPLEDWNANTFLAYIVDNTLKQYGVEYSPGGSGSKQQRWARERGMLKQAQERYGNAVLKRFIEICWREYRTNKPEQFPYPTVVFMISYMDRYFAQAQAEVVAENRRKQTKVNEINYEELEEWL